MRKHNSNTRQRTAPIWWYPALVAGVALACYIQTTTYGFVYDDNVQISLNPRIRGFSQLGSAFGENFWAFAGANSHTNYYRPLQTVSYMAGYAISGLSPAAYHTINMLLHIAASLGVFWLSVEFLGSWAAALWGGLFFAVHPMHTESVAWSAGITDVGCGLFYFLSVAAFLRLRRNSEPAGDGCHRKRAALWSGIALLSFLLSLLYKEMALTLPVTLILLDWARGGKQKTSFWPAVVSWLSPFVIVLLIYAGLRIHALGVFSRTVQQLPMSLGERILTMAYLVGRYFQDLIFPVSQNAFHVFHPFSDLRIGDWGLPVLLLLGCALLVWKHWVRDRELAILAILTGVTLTPVLNLWGVGQNIYTERYLYIPSAWFCLLVVGLIRRYLDESRVSLLLRIAIVGVCGFLTVERNGIWRDEKSLYAATLQSSPEAVPFHNNLGKLLFDERDYAGASRQFSAALNAYSKSFVKSPREAATSHLGLSSVASAANRIDEAIIHAEEARRLMPDWGAPYATLGMLTARQEKYTEAEKLLRHALQQEPGNATAHINLGSVLVNLGEVQEAEREFLAGIQLDPRLSGARVALALLLVQTNRIPEAILRLQEALALDPHHPQARRLLDQLSASKSSTK